MKQQKNEHRRSRPIKAGLEEDIAREYTWSQVKMVCAFFNLDEKEFYEWMNGKIGIKIEVDGRYELGYRGYDLHKWLEEKLG